MLKGVAVRRDGTSFPCSAMPPANNRDTRFMYQARGEPFTGILANPFYHSAW